MKQQVRNIAEASDLAARLPQSTGWTMPGGRELTIHRLSWLEFEQVWQAACGVLSALLLSDAELSEQRLATELAAAPQVVIELAARTSRLAVDEVSNWAFDDVLAAAAAGARFNFLESQGIRDFFSVAQQLASQEAAAARTGH